ncbi:MAG: DUF2007 domain-containing protein [Pseudomonadota bacterium]
MVELVRTNDSVLVSFIEVLLRDAGVNVIVADQNMSVLEGSLGVLPRRVLIDEADEEQAKSLLADAGVGDWIKGPEGLF